ncbi:MAG: hypothetical protein HQ494_15545 [Rhodospirillales bacterium]|nr:hypothetical protein [Rhodospirillales bacterium]
MNMHALRKRAHEVKTLVAANSNSKLAVEKESSIDRLEASVAIMVAELDYQEQTILKTRANMAELDIVMHQMEGNFRKYQRALSNINVRSLRQKCLRLASIARGAQGIQGA